MQYVVNLQAAEKYEGTEESANAIKAAFDATSTQGTVMTIVSWTPEVLHLAMTNAISWNDMVLPVDIPVGQWIVTNGFSFSGPLSDADFAQQFLTLPD